MRGTYSLSLTRPHGPGRSRGAPFVAYHALIRSAIAAAMISSPAAVTWQQLSVAIDVQPHSAGRRTVADGGDC
jgi:hypothetical protein